MHDKGSFQSPHGARVFVKDPVVGGADAEWRRAARSTGPRCPSSTMCAAARRRPRCVAGASQLAATPIHQADTLCAAGCGNDIAHDSHVSAPCAWGHCAQSGPFCHSSKMCAQVVAGINTRACHKSQPDGASHPLAPNIGAFWRPTRGGFIVPCSIYRPDGVARTQARHHPKRIACAPARCGAAPGKRGGADSSMLHLQRGSCPARTRAHRSRQLARQWCAP